MRNKVFATVVLLAGMAHAQVNVKGATVDATQGYTINGVAPNNQVLCGNGSKAVFAASCGTVSNPFYQFVQSNGGSPLPQRFNLNFDPNFTVADTSPSTTVHLAANISVNAATATNAANATNATNAAAIGGVALAGLCQTGGTGCPAKPPVVGSVANFTGSRFTGTTYQNTNAFMVYVSGYLITSGSAFGQVNCIIGSSSPSLIADSNQYGATTGGDSAGFRCMVPAGWFYQITTSGSATFSPGQWYETAIN